MAERFGRRFLFGATTIFLCPIVFSTGQTAQAAAPDPALQNLSSTYTDSQGVTHFPFDASRLPDASLVTQSGQDADGNCSFSDSGAGQINSTGSHVQVTEEVSFVAATCTYTIARVTYASSSVPSVVIQDHPEVTTDLQSVPGPSDAASPAVARFTGALTIRFKDPFNIVLSSTTGKVTYSGGSCTNSPAATFYNGWSWYTPTGWYRTLVGTGNSASCANSYANTLGNFQNDTFCGPYLAITTDHKQTLFEGKPFGGWYWSYATDKGGICADVLRFDTVLVTP